MIHYSYESNPSKIRLKEGDEVEYITRSGEVVKLKAVKLFSSCSGCWFIDEAKPDCAHFMCSGLILKLKCDDKDAVIKLSTIKSALCNSDVCIYYSDKCIQSYSSNKSCLINIIINSNV